MNPTLAGHHLSAVDLSSYLDLSTAENGLLRIENDYTFAVAGRELSTLAGQEDDIVELLEAMDGAEITSFDPTPSGGLVCRIGGGVLKVDPMDVAEAWSMVGPQGERIVSTPGGRLDVWGPQ